MALPEIFDAGVARRAIVEFLADELETLLAHVRSCKLATSLSEARGVEAVLKHFDVRRTDERE